MAVVFPFRAWRYDPQKVGSLADVLTQPYDKITPEMQERYYAHPFNLVRLILGKSFPDDDERHNVYTRAAEVFHQWLTQGIFIQETQPAFYVYYQRYRLPDIGAQVRKGFVGLGQLEDYGSGIVFPHEQTLTGPKLDRLKLLRATRAHFESLFMLYLEPERRIDALLDEQTTREPIISVRDEYGVEHLVWPMTDKALIAELQRLMADRCLIIADGHHRYETALVYRNERRAEAGEVDLSQPYERTVMTFFNANGEGLTILPTHRVLKSTYPFDLSQFLALIQDHFEIERYGFSGAAHKLEAARSLRNQMQRHGKARPTFGLYAPHQDAFYRLTLRDRPATLALMNGLSPRQRSLDVTVLHTVILEHGLGLSAEIIARDEPILYVREFEAGVRLVDEGQGAACFFLNPTRIEQVCDLALQGEMLPQKSTDFYPKLLSGLTIYRLS